MKIPSIDPYAIFRPNLHEFMQMHLQQFVMYIWTKCKPYKILNFLSEMKEYANFNIDFSWIVGHEL